LQYYDWLYKHHKPLAGTPEAPMSQWADLFGRQNYRSTSQHYIKSAKRYGMASMMYNLCYGAWEGAAADGVENTWYLFSDNNHTTIYPFNFGINLVDPGNAGWQNYIAQQNNDAYQVYDFDGYHIDQLGGPTNAYLYNGSAANLPDGFLSFIRAMKAARPDKKLVMNAVSEFGQTKIAQGEIDFFYNELWGGSYSDYVRIIKNNLSYNNNKQSTVFAAYTNYAYARDHTGFFNTSGVLFADAVIFAHGGAHIELGEHMLCNEYFPNSTLAMSEDLEQSLLSYYHFSVAYQNLLRDGGDFNTLSLTNTNGKVAFAPPSVLQQGKVAFVGKLVGDRQVIHLINFTNAVTMDARDVQGVQVEPGEITGINLQLSVSGQVDKVWVATPDRNSGSSEIIPFNTSGSNITFTLPYLKYWSMIVVEYK
jgi:dextranase